MAKKILFVNSLLLAANGLALTVLFAQMWYRDAVQVCEPIVTVRVLEVVAAAGMTILGLYGVARYLKGDQ